MEIRKRCLGQGIRNMAGSSLESEYLFADKAAIRAAGHIANNRSYKFDLLDPAYGRPSIETVLHCVLQQRFVLHVCD